MWELRERFEENERESLLQKKLNLEQVCEQYVWAIMEYYNCPYLIKGIKNGVLQLPLFKYLQSEDMKTIVFHIIVVEDSQISQ